MPKAKVYQGDVVALLPQWPRHEFDACITDPPYELGFMGKAWDRTGVSFNPDTWRLVRQVLKPGAHLLAFGGTRTFHRLTCAIEDAGFEIRDTLMWLYGSGFPKSLNLAGDWEGWGTALKPGWEPIILARAPLSEPTVAANVARWGTGALNVEGCRLGGPANTIRAKGHKESAFPHSDDNWRSHITHGGQDTMGRWPANVMLSHTPACQPSGVRQVRTASPVRGDEPSASTNGIYGAYGQRAASTGRGEQGREHIEAWACAPDCPVALLDAQSGIHKSPGSYVQQTHVNGQVYELGTLNSKAGKLSTHHGDTGGSSRFYYCAKASTSERNAGMPPGERNGHPTVKPVALLEWLTRLITPPNGVTIDPFCGSGSSGVAAVRGGWDWVGADLDPEAVRITRLRLAHALQARL